VNQQLPKFLNSQKMMEETKILFPKMFFNILAEIGIERGYPDQKLGTKNAIIQV